MSDVFAAPEWRALVRSMRAVPEDDTRRLGAADWLDEHDQPERAAFVRAQVEYARLHPHLLEFEAMHATGECSACDRGRVLSDLLIGRFRVPKNAPAPFAPDDPHHLLGLDRHRRAGRVEWDWYRGFLWEFRGTADEWLSGGDVLLDHHPLARVILSTWPATGEDTEHVWFTADPRGVRIPWYEVENQVRAADDEPPRVPYPILAILRCRFGREIAFRVKCDAPPRPTFTRTYRVPQWGTTTVRRLAEAQLRLNDAPLFDEPAESLILQQVDAFRDPDGGWVVSLTFGFVRPYFRWVYDTFSFSELIRDWEEVTP